MSTSDKSLSKKKARPLRKLISLAVLVGIAVAIKNALEDKGGSYEAPAPVQPLATTVPTPPAPDFKVATAEDIVESEPVENLDEFADPVEVEPPQTAADDPKEDEPTSVDPAVAAAVAAAEGPDDVRVVPGRIDPFGIR